MAYNRLYAAATGYLADAVYYAQIFDSRSGYLWDTVNLVMGNPSTVNYGDSVITMPELGESGVWNLIFPNLPTGYMYTVVIRLQTAVQFPNVGTPASTDNIVHSYDKQIGSIFGP